MKNKNDKGEWKVLRARLCFDEYNVKAKTAEGAADAVSRGRVTEFKTDINIPIDTYHVSVGDVFVMNDFNFEMDKSDHGNATVLFKKECDD